MKTMLISLAMTLVCATSYGQNWIEDSPQDWLTELQTQQASMQDLLDELRVVMDDVKKATDAANNAAADAQAAASEARALRLSNTSELEAAIQELRSRPAFTEEEIRAFAREEAQKLVATVKLPDGSTKEVKASDVVPVAESKGNTVSILGYAGTFDVPEGGYITHIDGKPVAATRVVATSAPAVRIVGRVTSAGTTDDYQFQATRVGGSRVRFFATPRATTCRIVNGVRICN